MNMNSKLLIYGILILTVFGLIFISGCPQAKENQSVRDCGEDESCFKEYGSSCSKLIFTSNEPEVGMIFEVEITGGTADECEVSVKLRESTQLPTLEGKEALCRVSGTSIYENGSDSINLLKHGDECEGPLMEELKQLFSQIASEMGENEKEEYPEIISGTELVDEGDPETLVRKYYESWDKGTFYNEGCVLTVNGYYHPNERCSAESKELTELVSGCSIDEYELANINTELIFQNDVSAEVYVEYDNLNACYHEEVGRISETVPLEKTDGGWKINELHLK